MKKLKNFLTILLIQISLTLLVGGVLYVVNYIQGENIEYEYSKFDTDGDGIFSTTEENAEQLYWERKVNTYYLSLFSFALFLVPTSIVSANILYFLWLILMIAIQKYKKMGGKKDKVLTEYGKSKLEINIKKLKNFLTILLIQIFLTFLIGSVLYTAYNIQEKNIKYQLSKFDIDGDSIFSPAEKNDEQLYWKQKENTYPDWFTFTFLLVPVSVASANILYVLWLILKTRAGRRRQRKTEAADGL